MRSPTVVNGLWSTQLYRRGHTRRFRHESSFLSPAVRTFRNNESTAALAEGEKRRKEQKKKKKRRENKYSMATRATRALIAKKRKSDVGRAIICTARDEK